MAPRLRQWLAEHGVTALVLAAAFALFLVVSYPGYMTYDSFDQLMQARKGPLTDWHPPFMAFTWRLLEYLWAGPQLMLMLQGGLFLAGTTVLLARYMRLRTAAIVAGVVFLFPPVIAPLVVIWKDCQMAGFLIAGLAAITARDRRWKLCGCVLLVFATAVRYNAAAATAPIVIGLFVWPEPLLGWRRYALAAAVWIAITLTALGIDALLVEKHLYPWANSVALLDIAGTAHYAHLDDAELHAALEGVPLVDADHPRERIDAAYHPYEWLNLTGGDQPVFAAPATPDQRDAVTHAWRTLVVGHPISYVHHRWRVFLCVLELGGQAESHVWSNFHGAAWEEDVLHDHRRASRIQRKWAHAMRAIDYTLVFKPWFYFLLAFTLLPLAKGDRLLLAFFLSGLLYELGLFIAAPSNDPRYSHWMIACTLVGAIIVFVTRWRSATRDRPALP